MQVSSWATAADIFFLFEKPLRSCCLLLSFMNLLENALFVTLQLTVGKSNQIAFDTICDGLVHVLH